MKRLHLALAGGGLSLLLAACSDTPSPSVQDWITQQRAQARTVIAPLPEPKPYIPQAYRAASAADPFDSQKLTLALRRDSTQLQASVLLKPELNRPRQPLEAFPLDAMTLLGSLIRQGQPVALIRIDRLVHSVRPGAYLGQNYGKVIRITDTQVLLREIVQDASGEWTERAASLQLQEERP
jgi:type IV pilus assembly protein PilP